MSKRESDSPRDALEANLSARFERVEAKLDECAKETSVKERFDKVDLRFERVEQHFDKVDDRFDKVNEEFTAVRSELVGKIEGLNRQMYWLIGVLFVALVSANHLL